MVACGQLVSMQQKFKIVRGMVGKGCLWASFVAVAIITVIILAATVWRSNNDWCNLSTNAGKCKLYDESKFCYCIDTFTKENSHNESRELGLYERSDQQCILFKGSLAIVDDEDLLIWLAKRMYKMGLDNALVALRKMGHKWFWMKDEVANEAKEIVWKKEFHQEPEETIGMITVETVMIVDEDYDFKQIYLNYDHYLDFDKSYGWYGFRASDNIFSIDKYFICMYDSESGLEVDETETDDNGYEKIEQNDRCACTSLEIQLSTADDSETFQSPGYPQNYCSDTNCRWIVSIPDGYAIKLDWLVFSTEFEMDMVFVYDGETDDSPLLAKCTGSMCTDQQSSGNRMQIHFRSDHVTTDLGFRARVTGIETNPCLCSESSSVSLANQHDTYTLLSPQYPEPYCMLHNCGWTINAPSILGLHISWNQFATERSKDVVFIYDGDNRGDGVLLMKCSGSSCEGIISPSHKVHIKFMSDDVASNDLGFKATISAVQNYCEQHDDRTDRGVVTYNSIRSDGRITVGTNATLTCAVNSKIIGTLSQTTDTILCQSPNWNAKFGTCEQACRIDLLEKSDHYNNITYCKPTDLEQELVPLISGGKSIMVEQYDFVNHATLNGPDELECVDGLWMPQSLQSVQCVNIQPKILLIGGIDKHSLELYYPENPSLNRLVDTALSQARSSHVSTLMADGSVITAGGQNSAYHPMKTCERYYPKDDKMVACPSLTAARVGAAAAALDTTPCICGGMFFEVSSPDTDFLASCECLKSDTWDEIASMNTPRGVGLGMVVVEGKLLATGGYNGDYFASVEQFDPEVGQWSFVASMIAPRSYHGAAVLYGKVYICGGQDGFNQMSSCEEYDIEKNIWSYAPQMKESRMQNVLSVISTGEVLLAVGGNIRYNQGIELLSDSVELYDPTDGKWRQIGNMTPRKEHSAVLIP